jgi:phosphocarrier protein HPr
MLRKKVEIVNKLGLHARAAAKFVATAGRYGSQIEVVHNDRCVNGKSIMGVMMLAASKGSEIELIVSGADQDAALEALVLLIDSKFNEAE